MRAVIMSFIAVAGFLGLAAPVQAAPAAPHYLSAASPAITMVVQRCGHGKHREAGWQDKHGVWHGKCVANPTKKTSPS